jgi:FAD/FMN-containing dehydrogenase
MAPSPIDWRALEDVIDGDVVLPDSPYYDVMRKPVMVQFHDVLPQAVIRCETDGDVVEAVSFVARFELRTAIRSGGHCFAGHSTTDGVVIDVSPLRSIRQAGDAVTVGAGTRLGKLYDALDRDGLTIPAGCGPTVGISGLTLGGGLGILGRRYGLTCDHLRRARVVLADGRVRDCDEHHNEDLFWGLRGGGSALGVVVTSLEFTTVPTPDATAFHLVWPHSAAAAVIEAWQAWAPDAPDELAASLYVKAGADPDRPPVINVFGAMLGTESDTATLLDELVVGVGQPPMETDLAHSSYRETKHYLVDVGDRLEGTSHGSPAEPGPAYSKSEFLRRPLPTDAVLALVEHLMIGRIPGESRALDFSPWAGAYNRVPHDSTAFVHRAERFLLKHESVLDRDASALATNAGMRWLRGSWAIVHPFGSGGVYPNFPDPDLEDRQRAYFGTNADRLARVKHAVSTLGAFPPGRTN